MAEWVAAAMGTQVLAQSEAAVAVVAARVDTPNPARPRSS